uniref:Uncharacterized protein n=1 Tax=Setaria italica TaxID=4555 RepID=K3Y1Q5_SETIT
MYFLQMWTYKQFMLTLNGYMRNKAFSEGSMIKGYHTKESVDCCIDYIKDKRAISLPESRHEARLSGRGTIGMKRFIDKDNQQLEKSHSSVLQQLAIVDPFIEKHLNEVRGENLANVGYKDDPWVFAERVAQVFYIIDPMNAKKHIIVSGKQRILGVEGVVDIEDYNQYKELNLFKDRERRNKHVEASIDKSMKPWLRSDCEGRIVKG